MSHTIPVIIHHETGAKKQSGGKKNQEYLRYCIEQAAKYNKKVVLLGDENNRAWCHDWHHVDEFPSARYEAFANVFQNFSAYPDSWAVSFFKRFFLIYEFLVKEDYEDCVILDSDILVYVNFCNYAPFASCDTALEIPENQNLPGGPAGNGMRQTACAGISYFKRDALAAFLDYCIETYADHADEIRKKWEFHQNYHLPGGVGEMTLLYRWTRTLPEDKVLNLLIPYENTVFDLNMCIPECFRPGEYEHDGLLRIKRLRWQNGEPYCRRLSDGRLIRFHALHFVDISKLYMYDFFTAQKISFPVRVTGFLWHMRSILAGIKHGDFHPFRR